MNEALALLREIDLSGNALRLWEFVESIDPCFGGLVVIVLICLGHKMAVGKRSFYVLGIRLGVFGFLVNATYVIIRNGGTEGLAWPTLISRSGLLAGAVVAATWITLPIVVFVYWYFRFGLTAFVVYGGYGLITAEAIDRETLPGIAWRGLFVAGLAMIVAWIVQPLWDILMPRRKVEPPAPKAAAEPAAETKKEEAKSDDTQDKDEDRRERRRWRRLMLMVTKPASQLSFFQPDDSRRRRDKARLTAELSYVMAMPEIELHFPRDMFESWVNRYLGDHLPAEEVEENSLHLQMIIAKQQKRQQGSAGGMNLEDLHLWYADEQKRIQGLDIDQATRQTKLLDLQELFLSMSQRLIGDPNTINVVPLVPRQGITLLEDKGIDEPDILPQAKAE